MSSPIFRWIYNLILLYTLYTILTISFTISAILLILFASFFLRAVLINPQVPFHVKLRDARMRIDYFLMGVYSGKFTLWRFLLVRKFNNLIGNHPPILPDPSNTYSETIQVPSLIDNHLIPMTIWIKNDVLNSEKKQPILFYLFPGAFQIEFPLLRKEEYLDMGMIIVKISYRLAPTYKFPLALEDSYSCLKYIANRSHPLLKYWDSRLVLSGGSAGGNLVATSALLIRDRGLNLNVICQILSNPAMFNREETQSHILYRDWYIHGEANVKFVDLSLLRDEKDYENPYLCPLKAKDLKNLPPAYFSLAERDYFCSDGELYYQKLKENGNDAVCNIYPAEHGFFSGPSPEAKQARKEMFTYLKMKINEGKSH